jgi:methionine synthase I (cobalamin-dependent)/5,10-methylenetetrahydrofolate reductase
MLNCQENRPRDKKRRENMTIQEYLRDHVLITDGAMGTYYAELTGDATGFSELATIQRPELIKQIHQEYIAAGAQLIRTNTFSTNPVTLNLEPPAIAALIRQSYALARAAADETNTYIAANIGPLPEPLTVAESNPEQFPAGYQLIADTFIACGATIFNFETCSSLDYLPEITAYIKAKQPRAFIIAQFAITPDGFTRKGLSAERIINRVGAIKTINAAGFNCGVGPTHLYRTLQKLNLDGLTLAVLPNAGYPEVVNERTIYTHNPEYFAERIWAIQKLGAKIIGGCCGTTPAHIRAIANQLRNHHPRPLITVRPTITPIAETTPLPNRFSAKLRQGKFVVAAELDPPFDAAVAKTMDRAGVYQKAGVDLITVADSPLAKARADAVLIAAKISRELGIETLPHLCCRDKNLNALKSTILAAHIEGIRNLLAVTGDPLPHAVKNEIKSVFNLNSIELIELITALNAEIFVGDPLTIGGALNLNAFNKEAELQRMRKKADKGATFFLTQPIFNESVIEFLPQLEQLTGVKILGGILPIVNYHNALFLKNEVPGMALGAELIARFDPAMDRATAEAVGIELAVEIGTKIRPFVAGFYFMTPFNRAGMVVEIIKRLQLD